MNDIKIQKKAIREKVKQLMLNISENERFIKSKLIFDKVESDSKFKNAYNILIYWPLKGEVDTRILIEKWMFRKTFYLPVIENETFYIKKFSGVNDLLKSKCGLDFFEPDGDVITDFSSIDIVIVPGIAFDKNYFRMGRGKGYYDKFLSEIKVYKIGLCFDFQLFDNIPTESHDIKMDIVYTNL
jgi:5-formyltetrahydrofolate cyclo-ligase